MTTTTVAEVKKVWGSLFNEIRMAIADELLYWSARVRPQADIRYKSAMEFNLAFFRWGVANRLVEAKFQDMEACENKEVAGNLMRAMKGEEAKKTHLYKGPLECICDLCGLPERDDIHLAKQMPLQFTATNGEAGER